MSTKFPFSFNCIGCGKPMTTYVMGLSPCTEEKCYDCGVYMYLHFGKVYAYYFVYENYSILYNLDANTTSVGKYLISWNSKNSRITLDGLVPKEEIIKRLHTILVFS